ncbi:MAG: peptide-methionine (S)-S-oxide reductase [Segetibacter sp.]
MEPVASGASKQFFNNLDGVLKVTSGYSGGHVASPTYEQVCSKKTGHAEVCRIVYDPTKITFEQIIRSVLENS